MLFIVCGVSFNIGYSKNLTLINNGIDDNEDTVAMYYLLDQYSNLMHLVLEDTISSSQLLNLTNTQFKARYNLPINNELDSTIMANGNEILDYWGVNIDSFGCIGCNLTFNEKVILLDTFRNYLNNNSNSLNNLVMEMKDNYLYISNGGGDPNDGPKCPASFYLCCATCAATIAAFPAYIMCCTVCLCGFCKNPPPSCNALPGF